MRQVMGRPSRQQRRQRHRPKRRMEPLLLQVFLPQMQAPQLVQILGSHPRKFIQQLPERFALNLALMPPAIERRKRLRLAKFQQRLHPWNPIRPLRVNQMSHHLERAPRRSTLISLRPPLRQIPQKGIERRRRSRKKRDRVLQVVAHWILNSRAALSSDSHCIRSVPRPSAKALRVTSQVGFHRHQRSRIAKKAAITRGSYSALNCLSPHIRLDRRLLLAYSTACTLLRIDSRSASLELAFFVFWGPNPLNLRLL